ncbi:MAG: TetR/AcrR family transcriptional regulator [Candidatus Dormibacteria bacterium]
MAYERLRSGDRRARLLELGVRIFSERPYDDFSMEEVALAAGVSKGLLYHYFPSKRDFYTEALRSAAATMLALTTPDPALPAAERLVAGLRAYFDYVRDHAGPYRAVLRGGIGSDPAVVEIAESFRRAILDRILGALDIGQPSPLVRTAIRGWIGLVEAASLDWLENRDTEEEQLVAYLGQVLTAALAAAGFEATTA